MNKPTQPPFSDELLSAYIDGDVTEEEKRQIETAMLGNPDLIWQVESLRQTVQLLRSLPSLPAPRSFLLTPEQVAAIPRQGVEDDAAGKGAGWRRLLGFFSGGNLLLRNATALAAVLFLILTVGQPMLDGNRFAAQEPMPAAAPAMFSMDAPAPAAAPAQIPEQIPAQIAAAEAPEAVESADAPEAEAPAAMRLADTPAQVDREGGSDSPDQADESASPMALSAFSEPTDAPGDAEFQAFAAPEGATEEALAEAPEEAPEIRTRSLLPPDDAEPAHAPEDITAAPFTGEFTGEEGLDEVVVAAEGITVAAGLAEPESDAGPDGEPVALLDPPAPEIQPGDALVDESERATLRQAPDPRAGPGAVSQPGTGSATSPWQMAQWAALALALLFLSLWLLSRRKDSPTPPR